MDALEILRELVEAIDKNTQVVNMPTFNWRDEYISMINKQHIADELEEARNLFR